jgi:hypothetical protein
MCRRHVYTYAAGILYSYAERAQWLGIRRHQCQEDIDESQIKRKKSELYYFLSSIRWLSQKKEYWPYADAGEKAIINSFIIWTGKYWIESKGEIFILAFSNNPPPLQRSLLTRYVNTQSFPRKEILPIAKVPPTIYSPRFAHVLISLSSQVWAVNSRYSSNYTRLDLNRRRHFRFTRLWHVRHFQSEYAT